MTDILPEDREAANWLTQGRKLQAEGKLPAGITLPDPEILAPNCGRAIDIESMI